MASAALLAAGSEQERGGRQAPTSKSWCHACHPEEGGAAAWNDGTVLPGSPTEGRHLWLHAAPTLLRKAGATRLYLSSFN